LGTRWICPLPVARLQQREVERTAPGAGPQAQWSVPAGRLWWTNCWRYLAPRLLGGKAGLFEPRPLQHI
jgi:hypothetical protein